MPVCSRHSYSLTCRSWTHRTPVRAGLQRRALSPAASHAAPRAPLPAGDSAHTADPSPTSGRALRLSSGLRVSGNFSSSGFELTNPNCDPRAAKPSVSRPTSVVFSAALSFIWFLFKYTCDLNKFSVLFRCFSLCLLFPQTTTTVTLHLVLEPNSRRVSVSVVALASVRAWPRGMSAAGIFPAPARGAPLGTCKRLVHNHLVLILSLRSLGIFSAPFGSKVHSCVLWERSTGFLRAHHCRARVAIWVPILQDDLSAFRSGCALSLGLSLPPERPREPGSPGRQGPLGHRLQVPTGLSVGFLFASVPG